MVKKVEADTPASKPAPAGAGSNGEALPSVLSLKDIAADLGVTHNAAHQYHKRGVRNRRNGVVHPSDLPPPDLRVGGRPAWYRHTYLAWKPGRPGTGAPGKRRGKRSKKG